MVLGFTTRGISSFEIQVLFYFLTLFVALHCRYLSGTSGLLSIC